VSRYDDPSVVLSSGPVRVEVSNPDPEFTPRPVGFVANARALEAADPSPAWRAFGGRQVESVRPAIAEADPDVWGDQA
jgi:hypothetical protein